jgi:hypothetical protein
MPDGMPSWEEWNGLDQSQRDYSLYKVLSSLHKRIDDVPNNCQRQVSECKGEFASKKDVGWLKWGIRAIILGMVSAFFFIFKK